MGKEYRRISFDFGLEDHRPPVLLRESFKNLNSWIKIQQGDSTIRRLLSPVMFPPSSITLKTRSTSAATGDKVLIKRYFTFPLSQIVSIMAIWQADNSFARPSMTIELEVPDGINYNKFGIQYRWLSGTPLWKYKDSSGSFVNLNLITQPLELGVWYKTILTVNLSTGKYVSLSTFNQKIDLSSLSFELSADATLESPILYLACYSLDTASEHAVTFNEVLILDTPIENFEF